MSSLDCRNLHEMQNLQTHRVELNNLIDNSFKYLPPCLKLLSLISTEPITRINMDQSLSLDAFTAFYALKVLIIDGKFLSDMLFSHSIAPFLKVLVITYANLRIGANGPVPKKVKLRKLHISAVVDLIDQNAQSPFD
ncbi:hypothetical protein VCUG_00597 [Vavraia culicis subsp. floridensis]|uniref:Uncharacterized protein n=1 Tax=Vavraia culicis (isolate floridensis) TaxID=948595 RepID=L2GX23_VAVCU|nr:uncharacterized protein VCUG_00597 [Vavraia culicis subsp. floridensis]ELA47877.1 hypothetical protein VCUG_00597 [Vavraia culicis subsp. floridensis]